MDWYVRDIVVYGEGGETRTVSFGPGVNIITGMSRTGKSACTTRFTAASAYTMRRPLPAARRSA